MGKADDMNRSTRDPAHEDTLSLEVLESLVGAAGIERKQELTAERAAAMTAGAHEAPSVLAATDAKTKTFLDNVPDGTLKRHLVEALKDMPGGEHSTGSLNSPLAKSILVKAAANEAQKSHVIEKSHAANSEMRDRLDKMAAPKSVPAAESPAKDSDTSRLNGLTTKYVATINQLGDIVARFNKILTNVIQKI